VLPASIPRHPPQVPPDPTRVPPLSKDELADVEAFRAEAERAGAGSDPDGLAAALGLRPPLLFRRAVQVFSVTHLPHKGWRRVLDLRDAPAWEAVFLGERGYDVTLGARDGLGLRFARHRLSRRSIRAAAAPGEGTPGRFDAIIVREGLDGSSRLPRSLASALRWRGVVLCESAPGDVRRYRRRLVGGLRPV
jgi:hypothetical protein